MGRFRLTAAVIAGAFAVAGLMGCGLKSAPTAIPENSQELPADTLSDGDGHHGGHGDHSGHGDHASHKGHDDMAKMKEGLAKLSAADRASAEKQHMCPVSGEMLGTMGEPIKLTVNGRDVWICCDGCRKPFESNPDKYLAKLNN